MKKALSLVFVFVLLLGMVSIKIFAIDNDLNPWEDRSVVFVGDSITAGSGTTKIYFEYLAERLGLSSVTPMSVGGSCISAASNYGQSNQPLINRYQNIPSADLIVVFMGTNDYGHETPLGIVNDTQDGTFYGALNTIVPELVSNHTSSKVVFVTPLHRYGFGTSNILGTRYTYDSVPNGVGATLGDYAEAIKTVCANNDVPVIDLYAEYILDPSDAVIRTEYMPDGLHPNAVGHEVIAGIMESHIRRLDPVKQEPVVLTEIVYGNRFAPGNNQTCRASSRINYYLKAGTIITLKDPSAMQWACTKTSDETSSSNLGYFPDSAWSDKETAVVAADGWIGFVFKYRDETRAFDLTKPLSDYITIEEPHTHNYGKTVTAPTCTEQGYTTYTCECGDSYVDDYMDAVGHTYKNGICTGYGATVSPYLQQLPEDIVGCTNLYDSLAPVKGYYTATKYDTSNGAVLSVVIPVEPGDRIAASSFGAISENMGSVNGIRVTYLLGDKIVTSLSAGDVYNGYTKNGYITVPDGVDAVCIPWWVPSDSNWLTLSQISKDFVIHSPKPVSAQAPTCTENGYTAGEICEVCNTSLGLREEIPATGHDYKENTCTICGTVNVLAILDGKYISVLGDSISTFNGYSNDSKVNSTIGGNGPRYNVGAADTKPGSYCLLESVNDTWWMHFANRSGMNLLVNNSWAGSQVFGGKTSDGRVIPAAYLDRCVNLHDNTLENNPGNTPVYPDVIFVYLGINDYNFNRSKVGTGVVDYAGLINSDGTYITPTTFGEAYGIMLHKMREAYPNTQIFAMTLLPENLYSVDKTSWEQHNAYIRAAAEYYGIPLVDLAENCAITWENYSSYMIDKIHPTTAGMKLISDCIEAELISYFKENPPHTHTYKNAITAPTCTEQGYTTYTCACGDSYTDAYVAALGHSYDNGVITTEPTCTEVGVKTFTCAACADTYTEEINKTGHIYESNVTAPTCTEQGYTTYTCECGDSYTDAYVAALGHSYDNGVITTEPTCTGVGVKTFTCAACTDTYTEEINETGHSYESNVTPPTCTEQGYTTYTCACGDSYVADEIPALGHTEIVYSAVEPTCTATGLTEGKKCSACGEITLAQEIISALGHTPIIDAAVEPTCTESGLTEGSHCDVCGEILVAQISVPVKGHSFGDWYETKAPTEAESGEKRRDCRDCEHYETATIATLNHSHDRWEQITLEAVEPTCTATGLTEGKKCSACGEITLAQEIISALGHTPIIDAAVEPTCTESGLTEGSHCDVCGEILVAQISVPVKGHSFGDWYETKAPTEAESGEKRRDCRDCEHYETATIATLNHSHDRWEQITLEAVEPTCTATGLTEGKKCSACGEITLAQETISALGHTPIVDAAVEPTCTESGLTEGSHCDVCGEILVIQASIPANGHSFDDGVITKEPTEEETGIRTFTCDTCGEEKAEVIPSLSHIHRYESIITAPNCKEQGYTTNICACGDSYIDTYVEATGHAFGAWAVSCVPTCTEKGEEIRICANCDLGERREIAAKGHDYKAVVTAPTCTEDGYTTHSCSCGDTYVDGNASALGHTHSDWIVDTEPAVGVNGSRHIECTACKEVLQNEPIEALPDGEGEPQAAVKPDGSATNEGLAFQATVIAITLVLLFPAWRKLLKKKRRK